jgi:quinol monooxygenase YgiN
MTDIFPMKNLTVVATFQARPGKEADLRAALISMLKPTRKEKGCLHYEVHEAPESRGRFLFFETWQDQAAFDSHMKSQHVLALLPRVDELCTQFPHVTIWQKIG